MNVLDGTESPEHRVPNVRALTDNEARRLISMAEEWHRTGHGASDVLWHGLVLLRVAGLRVGELLALRWCDVDLEAAPPTITVEHTLPDHRGTVGGLGPTKGGTTDMIALHESAVAVFTDRRSRGRRPNSFVFATRSGKPVTQANFRRALRDLVRDSYLSRVHPHSLRKTLATKASEQLDLEAARDLLRHKDDKTTSRHYVERNNVRALDPRSLFRGD